MGSSFVVLFSPFIGEGSDLADIGNLLDVQNGFSVNSMESFVSTVLHRPAGLNKLSLNVVILAPPLKHFGSEFMVVVGSDNPRLTSPSDNAF